AHRWLDLLARIWRRRNAIRWRSLAEYAPRGTVRQPFETGASHAATAQWQRGAATDEPRPAGAPVVGAGLGRPCVRHRGRVGSVGGGGARGPRAEPAGPGPVEDGDRSSRAAAAAVGDRCLGG